MSAHHAPRDDADMVSLARAMSWYEWRRFLLVGLVFAQAEAQEAPACAQLPVLDARPQAAAIPFDVDERRKFKGRQRRIPPDGAPS